MHSHLTYLDPQNLTHDCELVREADVGQFLIVRSHRLSEPLTVHRSQFLWRGKAMTAEVYRDFMESFRQQREVTDAAVAFPCGRSSK